jgi:hypothetical protein
MAERVAGIGARDAEDEQALIWANAMTGVADDLLWPHRSPSDDAEGE